MAPERVVIEFNNGERVVLALNPGIPRASTCPYCGTGRPIESGQIRCPSCGAPHNHVLL